MRKIRFELDCVDAQTDFNLQCKYMPICTSYWKRDDDADWACALLYCKKSLYQNLVILKYCHNGVVSFWRFLNLMTFTRLFSILIGDPLKGKNMLLRGAYSFL